MSTTLLITSTFLLAAQLLPEYGCNSIHNNNNKNSSETHIVKTAIADGELRSATSAGSYDIRRVSDEGTYLPLPSYVNGHSRRPTGDKINGQNIPKAGSSTEPHLQHGGVAQASSAKSDSGGGTGGGNTSKVVETQSTTCLVTTEQLVATASATVTRVVQGLVTSEELGQKMSELLEVMTDRLSELQGAILKLENRVDDYNEALKRGKYQQMETLVPHCDNPRPSTLSDSVGRSMSSHQDGHKPVTSDSYENEALGEEAGVRGPEILKYNSSIHMETSLAGIAKKVFTYYWRIRDMDYKLKEWIPRRSFRSQSFYIYPAGYRLYMRSFPRQNEANFYIHVGITKGDFDETLKWPFPLKMRVAILDQTRDTRMFEDVTSRVWDPAQLCSEFNWQRPTRNDNHECVGLGFPHDVLYQRAYISADSLVVKLTVYLDS